MSELRPTLDEWVKRHDEYCTCEMLFDWTPTLCDCGQAERVRELANLKEYGNEWQRCAQAKDEQIAQLRAENKILTDALYTESVLKEREEKARQLAVHEAVMATSERNLANHSLNECRRERDERTAVIADLRADLAAAQKRWKEVYDGNEILMALVRIAQKREEKAEKVIRHAWIDGAHEDAREWLAEASK